MLVDTGDMLHMGHMMPETELPSLLAKGEVYMKAHTKLGYVAQAIGDRDLKLIGVEGLKSIESKGKVPFVCANLVDKEGRPAFKPYVMVEKQGFKFAFLGLITPTAALSPTSKELDLYKIESALEAAKKVLPEIQKEKPTAVILLAHMERHEMEQLTKELPGIDIIMGGQTMGNSSMIERINDTWFVDGGQRGQVLNMLTMHLTAGEHKPFVVREGGDKLKAEVARIDSQIKRYVQIINNPAQAGTRGANKDRFKSVVENLLQERKGLAEKAKSLSKPDVDAPFLALDGAQILKDLADEAEILGWIDAYEAKYANQQAHAPHQRVPPVAPHKLKNPATGGTINKVPHDTIRRIPKPPATPAAEKAEGSK